MVCSIKDAWLCQDCFLVTVDPNCDLCGKPTIPHPEAADSEGPSYCIDCAGEVIRESAIVLTWKDDQYIQCDDGMLITVCQGCEMSRVAEMQEDS